MKKMKMIVSLILCFTMLCPAVTYASENEKINLNNFEEMKDIIINSATDYYIVVSVPIEKAEMYQKQLENDSEFRESEIDEVLASLDTDSRAYPPGRIISQTYMHKKDIKKAIDKASGTGTFDKWISGIGGAATLADIVGLIKLSKTANACIFAAQLFSTLVQWVQQQQEKWWKEAYRDIINGKISAVRYTIIENPTEYPKIWRVFERV